MNEDEAKTKWCPFSRVSVTEMGSDHAVMRVPSGAATFNRLIVDGKKIALPQVTLCIGSACMAWQAEGPENLSSGYCGLVGRS